MPALTRFLLGPKPEQDVPDRIRDAIARQQNESEILIGWVQLCLVAVLGTLYAISPKTFDETAPFEPVPWVVGALGVLTALRLLLAWLDRLPRWFLALSVAGDTGLLIGLIWSFHIQYGQPPGFYLKAPTMLYLFVILVLRALRFEARYVIIAGVVAAAGWAYLVYYAVSGMRIADPVTTDFVQYVTSYQVLIGAEFDKILAILAVTAVLSLAIVRANRLLERAAVEGQAARDLSRFFAPEVASRITGAETEIAAGEGEARDAAILMVDLRGFSVLAERIPPSETMAILAEYEATIVPVIRGCGGVVDKFMGDGILATFGAARPNRTATRDALDAATAVVTAARTWSAQRRAEGKSAPRAGVGVASGTVIFGALGYAERLEYTVIGAAVNMAAKLEKHTKVLDCHALTDAQTLARARAQGWQGKPARELSAQRVEGVDAPMDLVVIA